MTETLHNARPTDVSPRMLNGQHREREGVAPVDADWELSAADTGFVLRPRRRPPVEWQPAWPPPFPARPAAPVARGAAGWATVAGWSFLERPTVLGDVPAAGGFLVEIGIDAAGVRVDGRAVAPRTLAEQIAACRGTSAPRPLVLLLVGQPPPAAAAALLAGGLADALGEHVITADAGIAVAANGVLITGGTFHRWLPRRTASGAPPQPRRVEALGPVLPPRRTGVATPVRDVRLYVLPEIPPARRSSRLPTGKARATDLDRAPGVDAAGPEPVALTEAAITLLHRTVMQPRPALPEPRITALPRATQPPAEPAASPAEPVSPAGWNAVTPVPPVSGPPAIALLQPAPVVAIPIPPMPNGATSALRRESVTPASTGAARVGSDETRAVYAPVVANDDDRSVRSESIDHRAVGRAAPVADLASAARGSEALPAEASAATAMPAEANLDLAEPSALWLPGGEPDADRLAADRVSLRRMLDGRYDAHARVVAKVLSEEPGLRAVARSAPDIAAGLVAVRAYLLDERDRVNGALRSGAEPADAAAGDVEVLARMATLGLRRLPPVFGPVFGTAPGGAVSMDSYRPGTELIEPALVDVELTAGKPAEHGVEFAIWSVSARRLAGLGARDGTALFPPGSRFAVLAVDDVDGGGPARVLLRDLGADRGRPARATGANGADRIVARLRETPRTVPAHPAGAGLRFPVGLSDHGRPYRRPGGNSRPSASIGR